MPYKDYDDSNDDTTTLIRETVDEHATAVTKFFWIGAVVGFFVGIALMFVVLA